MVRRFNLHQLTSAPSCHHLGNLRVVRPRNPIRRGVIRDKSRSAIAMGRSRSDCRCAGQCSRRGHRRNRSASFLGGRRDRGGGKRGHGSMKAPRDAAGQIVNVLGIGSRPDYWASWVWIGLLLAVDRTSVCTCPTGAFDPLLTIGVPSSLVGVAKKSRGVS